jgi:hypothetical protein
MTDYRRKTLLQRIDGLVEWTGIPRFARRETRMRRLKWLPIAVLLLATAGLVVVIGWGMQYYWLTTAILIVAGSVAGVLQQLGPLRRDADSEREDEREQDWRRCASGAAFTTVSIVVMIGIGSLGLWTIISAILGWSSASQLDLGCVLLAFVVYLLFLLAIVPTLYASWTLPDFVEDEPEPEGGLRFVKPRRH